MSVQSEIDRINGEISNQETLIDEILAILDNKAVTNPKLQEKTVTPSAVQQEVKPDAEYDGLSKVVVNGDNNLIPENIKDGISIFGVEGSILQGIPIPNPITGGETVVMTSSKKNAVITQKNMTATGVLLQVKKAGTYRFMFSIAKKKSASGNASSDSGAYAQLYKNGKAISGAVCGNKSVSKANFSQDISAAVNDTFEIYAKGSTDSNDNPIQCNITSALTIGVSLDLSYFN